MERMEFDLLFRWFVGLGIDDPVWDATTFTKNRDRLLEGDVARAFLAAVLAIPRVKRLLSSDHFSVDGTLIEAWASMKSFTRKDDADRRRRSSRRLPIRPVLIRPPAAMPRSTSTANGAATPRMRAPAILRHRLYRKGRGREAKLCYIGHALMENRNGLIVDACVTQADGSAPERNAALAMIEPLADRPNRITVGADKPSIRRISSTNSAR